MKLIKNVFVLFFIMIFAGACGNSETEKKLNKAAEQMKKAGEQLGEKSEDLKKNMEEGQKKMANALEKMGESISEGSKIEPVDFRKLKDLLPEKLDDMKRTDKSGEKTGAMGIKISKAISSYESGNNQRITIEITDMGNVSHFTAMADAAWTTVEIDKETDTGYEKTIKYKGHKGFEKYNTKYKDGSIEMIISERFFIEISGNNVKMDAIKDALDEINIRKLEKMID
jgi:hypothetical protein